MNNEQAQNQEQQEQQEQDHAQLRRERSERGEVRNAHLEAGREQARRDNALSRERNATGPAPMEDEDDIDHEEEGDSQ